MAGTIREYSSYRTPMGVFCHARKQAERNNQPDNQPKNNATILLRTMANDPPLIKPWGKFNKKILQELIDEGKVDIACASDTRYIDRVRHKYFRERDVRNFCRNFRSYARSCQLEDEVSGYRRRQGKKLRHYFYH